MEPELRTDDSGNEEQFDEDPMVNYVIPAGGNIFAHIGFPIEEAERLLIRADLLNAITDISRERGLRPSQAARLFGVSRRTFRKVSSFRKAISLDTLLGMLVHAGFRVRMSVSAIPEYDLAAAQQNETTERVPA